MQNELDFSNGKSWTSFTTSRDQMAEYCETLAYCSTVHLSKMSANAMHYITSLLIHVRYFDTCNNFRP
jgi:hypothetical protein